MIHSIFGHFTYQSMHKYYYLNTNIDGTSVLKSKKKEKGLRRKENYSTTLEEFSQLNKKGHYSLLSTHLVVY